MSLKSKGLVLVDRTGEERFLLWGKAPYERQRIYKSSEKLREVLIAFPLIKTIEKHCLACQPIQSQKPLLPSSAKLNQLNHSISLHMGLTVPLTLHKPNKDSLV